MFVETRERIVHTLALHDALTNVEDPAISPHDQKKEIIRTLAKLWNQEANIVAATEQLSKPCAGEECAVFLSKRFARTLNSELVVAKVSSLVDPENKDCMGLVYSLVDANVVIPDSVTQLILCVETSFRIFGTAKLIEGGKRGAAGGVLELSTLLAELASRKTYVPWPSVAGRFPDFDQRASEVIAAFDSQFLAQVAKYKQVEEMVKFIKVFDKLEAAIHVWNFSEMPDLNVKEEEGSPENALRVAAKCIDTVVKQFQIWCDVHQLLSSSLAKHGTEDQLNTNQEIINGKAGAMSAIADASKKLANAMLVNTLLTKTDSALKVGIDKSIKYIKTTLKLTMDSLWPGVQSRVNSVLKDIAPTLIDPSTTTGPSSSAATASPAEASEPKPKRFRRR